MDIPLCDLGAQYRAIADEVNDVIQKVVASTRYIGGPEVSSFESEFADFCGANHAVGVSSGTSALHLAFIAAGVGPGDEVLTVAHTFIATAEPIVSLGARARFVDIDETTYNMDVSKIEAAITEKTKVLLPVHLYGQPVDMDPILELAERRGLKVIEDAAQAHGAQYKGERTCGSLAPLGTFSFYPGKNLGAYGDAGAVTCADPALADRINRLANHGRADKYLHDEEGYNYRLDALQAAILRVKLRHLRDWTEGRRRVAALYHDRLQKVDGVSTPFVPDWANPVWHLYVVRIEDRDRVFTAMREAGIDVGIHYPVPLHLQPAYQYLGYNKGDFPVSERVAGEILSLPIFPEMTETQVDRVVSTLRSLL